MHSSIVLALMIFGVAILVVFSEEFTKQLKRLFRIPGLSILLPLLLASVILEFYRIWFSWFFFTAEKFVDGTILFLAQCLSFAPFAKQFAAILYLLCISLPFIAALHAVEKRNRGYQPWPYAYVLVKFFWFASVILGVMV